MRQLGQDEQGCAESVATQVEKEQAPGEVRLDIDRGVMHASEISIGCADAAEFPTALLSAKWTSVVDITGICKYVVLSTRGSFHNGTALRPTMIGGVLVARFLTALARWHVAHPTKQLILTQHTFSRRHPIKLIR